MKTENNILAWDNQVIEVFGKHCHVQVDKKNDTAILTQIEPLNITVLESYRRGSEIITKVEIIQKTYEIGTIVPTSYENLEENLTEAYSRLWEGREGEMPESWIGFETKTTKQVVGLV